MAHRDGWLVALICGSVAAVALSACGKPAQAPTAEAGSEAVVTSAPVQQPSDDLVGFVSPSGNVSCMLQADYVRCDIRDRDWSPPPRPADCEFDYGQGIAISGDEPAAFVCAGDTTLGTDEVLRYGESVTAGPMRCESAEAGVTCRNSETGQGFFLSRQSYRLS